MIAPIHVHLKTYIWWPGQHAPLNRNAAPRTNVAADDVAAGGKEDNLALGLRLRCVCVCVCRNENMAMHTNCCYRARPAG
jgi:hypothetical protein